MLIPDAAERPKKRPKKRPRASTRYERLARADGYGRIAGVDEVGRGCLCGPVVAAAVILDPSKPIQGLADSKTLDAEQREVLDGRIRERAIGYAVGAVDAAWIDHINIYQASRKAMEIAVDKLNPAPDYLLVDAMQIGVPLPQKAIIKGDAKSRSIAAASIVAKVERDRWMRRFSEAFPEYNLESNKGYGTPDHLAALDEHGPTPIHRHSFEPVAKAARFSMALPAEARPRQFELFEQEEALND